MCYPTPNAKPRLVHTPDIGICFAFLYTNFLIFFEVYHKIFEIVRILSINS